MSLIKLMPDSKRDKVNLSFAILRLFVDPDTPIGAPAVITT